MRLQDIRVGDAVVVGKQQALATGRGGEVAYVVGIGHFTEVWQPCKGVVPYTPKYPTQKRVVIAEEVKRWAGGELELVWVPKLKSPRTLMDLGEYRRKEAARKKVERSRIRHEREGRKLREAAGFEVAEALGLRPGHVEWTTRYDRKSRRSTWHPQVRIDVDEVTKMLGKRVHAEILQDLRAWEAQPDPGECEV